MLLPLLSPLSHYHCHLFTSLLFTFYVNWLWKNPLVLSLGSPHLQKSHVLWQVSFLAMTLPHAKLYNPFSFFTRHKVWPSMSTLPLTFQVHPFLSPELLCFAMSVCLLPSPVVNFVVCHSEFLLQGWVLTPPTAGSVGRWWFSYESLSRDFSQMNRTTLP